jgi:hypothetical protein
MKECKLWDLLIMRLLNSVIWPDWLSFTEERIRSEFLPSFCIHSSRIARWWRPCSSFVCLMVTVGWRCLIGVFGGRGVLGVSNFGNWEKCVSPEKYFREANWNWWDLRKMSLRTIIENKRDNLEIEWKDEIWERWDLRKLRFEKDNLEKKSKMIETKEIFLTYKI